MEEQKETKKTEFKITITVNDDGMKVDTETNPFTTIETLAHAIGIVNEKNAETIVKLLSEKIADDIVEEKEKEKE